MTATITLWRPTGPEELAYVEGSGWRRWPARLPEQPIFYPVLNEEYATKIASDWNVAASGVGFVTRFTVRTDFLSAYDVQQAGGRTILEYWIPADDLDAFNDAIVGEIELVATFGDPDLRMPPMVAPTRPLSTPERFLSALTIAESIDEDRSERF